MLRGDFKNVLSLSLTKLIPSSLWSKYIEPTLTMGFRNRGLFGEKHAKRDWVKCLSPEVYTTQFQFPTFLSPVYLYNDPIQSPGKHLERFPLPLPGLSGMTTVLFWTFQQLFCAISQNHRATEGLMLEGTSYGDLVQPPYLKEGWLQQIAQSHVQLGFNISRDGDTRTSLGSLPQPLTTYAVFAYMGFPMLQSMPIAFCPVTGHHWAQSSCHL